MQRQTTSNGCSEQLQRTNTTPSSPLTLVCKIFACRITSLCRVKTTNSYWQGQGYGYHETQYMSQDTHTPPISSPLCLLTRYYSRTFSNYSDMFPKKFSVYCILTTGLRVSVLTFLCFKKNHHFILISGWQKREDLSLKCFRDPMRNVFIFVCGPAVLSVVWHFNFLFLSYGGILISSHFFSFLHYRNLTGISISTICFLFTFINIETNN